MPRQTCRDVHPCIRGWFESTRSVNWGYYDVMQQPEGRVRIFSLFSLGTSCVRKEFDNLETYLLQRYELCQSFRVGRGFQKGKERFPSSASPTILELLESVRKLFPVNVACRLAHSEILKFIHGTVRQNRDSGAFIRCRVMDGFLFRK